MSSPQAMPELFNSPQEVRVRILQLLRQTERKWRPWAEDFLPWVRKLQALLSMPLAGMVLGQLGVDREQLTRLLPLLQYLPPSLDSWETDAWHLLNLVPDDDLMSLAARVEGVATWVVRP